jgi:lipoprotein signal peptidase
LVLLAEHELDQEAEQRRETLGVLGQLDLLLGGALENLLDKLFNFFVFGFVHLLYLLYFIVC